jgi:hypothetical protein
MVSILNQDNQSSIAMFTADGGLLLALFVIGCIIAIIFLFASLKPSKDSFEALQSIDAEENSHIAAAAASGAYRSTTRDYFYYISTDEGIISHYQDLEHVWNAANAVGRHVYVVPFESTHYPGIKINLCDIFQLPANITCVKTLPPTVFQKNDCVYTQDKHPPARYNWPTTLKRNPKFNYADVECIAGVTYPNIGISPVKNHTSMLSLPVFRWKYRVLLPKLTAAIGVSAGKGYITAHW